MGKDGVTTPADSLYLFLQLFRAFSQAGEFFDDVSPEIEEHLDSMVAVVSSGLPLLDPVHFVGGVGDIVRLGLEVVDIVATVIHVDAEAARCDEQ